MKTINLFLLLVILSSCKKELPATISNLKKITQNHSYIIKVKTIGGSFGGSFKQTELFKVKDDNIEYSGLLGKGILIEMDKKIYDSTYNFLKRLTALNIEGKQLLEGAGCGMWDEKYIIENEKNKMIINPPEGRYYCNELLEFYKLKKPSIIH